MTLWHPVVFDVLPPAEVVSDEASATEQGWVTECVRTGPCIVVAGPGVGKSHSLVVRLHRRCRLDPSARALVLTFTVGAGRILEHRLVGSALEHAAVVVRRTQQEIWGAFSRAHTDAKGRRTLQVASRTRARKLLCNAIFDEGYYLTNLERTVKGALSAIEEASDIPEELADVVTPAVLLRYKRAKSQAGLADNGDVRRWAIEHVDEIVAHWVSQGFTEVYLDEAQDSSPTEIALMAAAARGGLRVCCVLDLRQALYGFRGARPHDLLAVLESLPGAHKHLLAVNRRSAEQVVSTLNAFSTWAFEGESSQAMAALRVGGEPFRAVTCEERATVYEAMGAALGAVAGIPRDHRQDVPKKNRHLRDALGLPAVLAPEQSIGILTATGKEAGDIVRELEAMGYAPVKLVRDKDDVAAHELLHGFLDPLGEHGGPARIYGEGSPICLVLGIIRRQGPFRMDPQSKGHKAFDTLVRDLRRVAYGGPRDHTECFWHLWSMARGSCARWAEGCSPADGPKSRLRALAVQARDCLDEWGTILNECPLPCRCRRP